MKNTKNIVKTLVILNCMFNINLRSAPDVNYGDILQIKSLQHPYNADKDADINKRILGVFPARSNIHISCARVCIKADWENTPRATSWKIEDYVDTGDKPSKNGAVHYGDMIQLNLMDPIKNSPKDLYFNASGGLWKMVVYHKVNESRWDRRSRIKLVNVENPNSTESVKYGDKFKIFMMFDGKSYPVKMDVGGGDFADQNYAWHADPGADTKANANDKDRFYFTFEKPSN